MSIGEFGGWLFLIALALATLWAIREGYLNLTAFGPLWRRQTCERCKLSKAEAAGMDCCDFARDGER